MTLGKGLGTPIGLDQRMIDRKYGYFANVLVDIDLAKPVPDRIIVKEEAGLEFTQPVEIPKLPAYCNHYKGIGHEITQCRGLWRVFQEPNRQCENEGGQIRGAQRGGTKEGHCKIIAMLAIWNSKGKLRGIMIGTKCCVETWGLVGIKLKELQ